MMMRTVPIVAVVVTLTSISSTAVGEEADARLLFEQGVEHFADEEFERALDEFSRSYQMNPVITVLYNLAMCQRALDQTEASIATFERYLDDAGDRISTERREEVSELIEDMSALVAETTEIEDRSNPSETSADLLVTQRDVAEDSGRPLETPEAPSPVVRRWWFWTVVGSVVVASAVGVGLGVGLSRD